MFTWSIKGTVSRDFCFRFFNESTSPKPLKITVGSFRFFSKIHRDIRQSRCTTGVKDTGGNDTGGAHWAANISANVKRKSKTALMVYSGAWGKLIHKKTRSRKSRDTVLLTRCSDLNLFRNERMTNCRCTDCLTLTILTGIFEACMFGSELYCI